jgi:hypothetical protein
LVGDAQPPPGDDEADPLDRYGPAPQVQVVLYNLPARTKTQQTRM